jgi:hypothetical protein
MKRIIFLTLYLTFSCHAEIINFDFFGTNDKKIYNSTTVNEDIKHEYGKDFKINSTILIESNCVDDEMLITQNKILYNLPHGIFEKYAAIIVMSLTCKEYKSGYHTSVATAKRLAGDYKKFRITILSSEGVIIKRSNAVFKEKEIIEIISFQKI